MSLIMQSIFTAAYLKSDVCLTNGDKYEMAPCYLQQRNSISLILNAEDEFVTS